MNFLNTHGEVKIYRVQLRFYAYIPFSQFRNQFDGITKKFELKLRFNGVICYLLSMITLFSKVDQIWGRSGDGLSTIWEFLSNWPVRGSQLPRRCFCSEIGQNFTAASIVIKSSYKDWNNKGGINTLYLVEILRMEYEFFGYPEIREDSAITIGEKIL